MKKILLILALIAISSCQELVLDKWNRNDSPFQKEFSGAAWGQQQEIALYGWFRFDSNAKGINNLLILSQQKVFEATKNPGSRLFGLYVTEFDIEASSYGNTPMQEYIKFGPGDKDQWTFFHFSYSFATGKANYYMKLAASGDKSVSKVVNQNQSTFYRLYVGQANPNFSKFSGQVSNVYLQTGPGSYKESGYESLMAVKPAQNLFLSKKHITSSKKINLKKQN